LDSSGVSILIIAMQTCKQKKISFTISAISEEAMRVLQLAKLDKILPITALSGPADLVDVDVFSKTGDGDTAIASEIAQPNSPADSAPKEAPPMTPSAASSADDDLIAAIASGDMASAPATEPKSEPAPEPEPAPAPEPAPEPEPAPKPAPAPTPAPDEPEDGSNGASGSGGGFTPGTFG
jgi:outer membrane biosynthesis protein TonB